jgi:serine/threonine-protein kinase ATR
VCSSLSRPPSHLELKKEVGGTWLTSAKIARKAGHWQTAYSAMLQSRQHDAQLYCLESAKLIKASGEPLRALQELENYMRAFGFVENSTATVVDLTINEESMAKMKSKVS